MIDLASVEVVAPFADLGVRAFTTTRATADFRIPDAGPDTRARARWHEVLAALGPAVDGLVSAHQVHGRHVRWHDTREAGWLRVPDVDGHLTALPGTALAVTVADCIPVFLWHPAGVVGLLHAGWRGVAAQILAEAVRQLHERGCAASDLVVHCGPAISGRAYEVGPEVFTALTGWETTRPRHVDLRALIAEQARALGVRQLTMSVSCTVEDNATFYSHRQGDAGRQIAVIVAPGS